MTTETFITKFIQTRGKLHGNYGKFYARDGVLFIQPANHPVSLSVETFWKPIQLTPNVTTLIPVVWFPNPNFYVTFGHGNCHDNGRTSPFSYVLTSLPPNTVANCFLPPNTVANCFPNRKSGVAALNNGLQSTGLPRAGNNMLPIRYAIPRLFGDDAMSSDELLCTLSRAIFGLKPSNEFAMHNPAHDSYGKVFAVCPDNADYVGSSAAQLLFDFAVTAWAHRVLKAYREIRDASFQLRDLVLELSESADIHGSVLHKLGAIYGSSLRSLDAPAIISARDTIRAACSKMFSANANLSPSIEQWLETLLIPISNTLTHSFTSRERMLTYMLDHNVVPPTHITFALGNTSSDSPVTVDSAFATFDQVKKHFNALIKCYGHSPIQDPFGIPLEPDNLEALATAHDLVKHDLLSLQVNE